jgi:hypothetical protein
MVDQTAQSSEPTTSICPWCSASYQGDPENCPSCGATLTGEAAANPSLPGLTAIDAAAIVRAKEPVKKSRNRLLSWISGDYPDEAGPPTTTEAGALAPPDADVRREILRLELEAEVANLQAEADALRAEATVEGRLPTATPEDAAAAAAVVGDIDAVSAELDTIDEELDTDSLVEVIGTPEDAATATGAAADDATEAAKAD